MLVLSRKIGNRIVIAGNIEITVVQVRGNKVRLGVNAPRHISIARRDGRQEGGEGRSRLQDGSTLVANTRTSVESSRKSRTTTDPL